MPDPRPIGVFDSGVGGLTVLRELQNRMPLEKFIYYGDTANAPYGEKTPQQLLALGRRIVQFLLARDVKAIVMACGTSSSTSYAALTSEFASVPFVDTIRPAVRETVKLLHLQPTAHVVFAATQATVNSGAFSAKLLAEMPSAHLTEVACPLFAPLVEAGLALHHLAAFAADTYLGRLYGQTDALVLGCTHFPLLAGQIRGALGCHVQLINPAVAVAEALSAAVPPSVGPGGAEFFTSGDNAAFDKAAQVILGTNISSSTT
jgi:glutamate racemase